MNATAEKLAETKKAQYWERKEDMRIIREEHEKVKEQREKEIAASFQDATATPTPTDGEAE